MGYGIQDFYKTAFTYGLGRDNLFRLKNITNDAFLPNSLQDLYVFAKSAMIPSRIVNQAKVSWKSFEFNVPLGISYPEATSWPVTFYSDQSHIIRSLFELWSKKTFSEHGHFSMTDFGNCDIEMVLLDSSTKNNKNDLNDQDREIAMYKLKGCYPTNTGTIQYDATSSGTIVSLNINLAFQYIESTNNKYKLNQ